MCPQRVQMEGELLLCFSVWLSVIDFALLFFPHPQHTHTVALFSHQHLSLFNTAWLIIIFSPPFPLLSQVPSFCPTCWWQCSGGCPSSTWSWPWVSSTAAAASPSGSTSAPSSKVRRGGETQGRFYTNFHGGARLGPVVLLEGHIKPGTQNV